MLWKKLRDDNATNWQKHQLNLMKKWKIENPQLTEREILVKYKNEWIQAFRPFANKYTPAWWLR